LNNDGRFHCITCSDEATPLRVIDVRDGRTVLCEGDVEVMTDLVGVVERDEMLLVHAGVALERIQA
jgi:hypothetical protein